MTTIRASTLGGLRVERDGREVRDLPAQPVRASLFLYLALERSATRDELLAVLWPERDAERGRHSLNQTLYELRRGLGNDWARTHGERIEVSPAVEVDALDFVAAADAGRDEEALELYRGGFLDGSHPGETPEFEAWLAGWRQRLSRLHRGVCRRLATARAEAGDREGGLAVAREWVERDPLDDEAQHCLIELLAATGRRSEALQQYAAYEDLLARELEVEPLDHTRELVSRIRRGRDTPAGPTGAAASGEPASETEAGGTVPAAPAGSPVKALDPRPPR
jgi:DNA-binding SARP family transcriptional activator